MLTVMFNQFNKQMCYQNSMSNFVRSFYNRINAYRIRFSCDKYNLSSMMHV